MLSEEHFSFFIFEAHLLVLWFCFFSLRFSPNGWLFHSILVYQLLWSPFFSSILFLLNRSSILFFLLIVCFIGFLPPFLAPIMATTRANHDDPYYLHPSDNPGLVLVSQPLTEDNCNSWRRVMLMVLNGKNNVGFVDGSLKKPEKRINRSIIPGSATIAQYLPGTWTPSGRKSLQASFILKVLLRFGMILMFASNSKMWSD